MARNVEREALGSSELVPDNSELRTYNSELGKAGDSELGKAGDSELVHASRISERRGEQSPSVIGLTRKNSTARIHA